MKKVCFKCSKKIDVQKDHFFIFTEMLEGAEVNEHYAHKECWDKVKSTLEVKDKAHEMLDGLHGYLGKMGLIKKEYVIP